MKFIENGEGIPRRCRVLPRIYRQAWTRSAETAVKRVAGSNAEEKEPKTARC